MLLSDFRLPEHTVCLPQLLSAEDSLYIVSSIYFGQLLVPLGVQSPLSWYRNSLPLTETILYLSRIHFISGCDAVESGKPLILPSFMG
jgi:hypothetical protein